MRQGYSCEELELQQQPRHSLSGPSAGLEECCRKVVTWSKEQVFIYSAHIYIYIYRNCEFPTFPNHVRRNVLHPQTLGTRSLGGVGGPFMVGGHLTSIGEDVDVHSDR